MAAIHRKGNGLIKTCELSKGRKWEDDDLAF